MKLKGLKAIFLPMLLAFAMEQNDPAFAMPGGRDASEENLLTTAFSLAPREIWTKILKHLDYNDRATMKRVTKELYHAMWDSVDEVEFLQESIPEGLTNSRVFELLGRVKILSPEGSPPGITFLIPQKNTLNCATTKALESMLPRLERLEVLQVTKTLHLDLLAHLIPQFPSSLKQILLQKNYQGDLANFLKLLPKTLASLHIDRAQLTDEAFQALIQRLSQLQLQALGLQEQPLVCEHTEKLTPHFKTLEALYLNRTPLHTIVAQQIFQSLGTSLKELHLNAVGLDSKVIISHAQFLPEGLEVLFLAGNSLNLQAIQTLFQHTRNLTDLSFGHPEMPTDAFIYGIENLPQGLKGLMLYQDSLTLKGLEHFLEHGIQGLQRLVLHQHTSQEGTLVYLKEHWPSSLQAFGGFGFNLQTTDLEGFITGLPDHVVHLYFEINEPPQEYVHTLPPEKNWFEFLQAAPQKGLASLWVESEANLQFSFERHLSEKQKKELKNLRRLFLDYFQRDQDSFD